MAEHVVCDEQTVFELQVKLVQLLKFLNHYDWLMDAYVSDFFVCEYWNQLLPCWKNKLEMMSPPQHSILLNTEEFQDLHTIYPLSMLAFVKCISMFSLKRQNVDLEDDLVKQRIKCQMGNIHEDCGIQKQNPDCEGGVEQFKNSVAIGNDEDLAINPIFRRHVKPKKHHEIHRLAQCISLLSDVCNCKRIVDVGAGLGHLSRILTFSKGLSVTTVEAAGTHAPKAFKYDKEMERDITKVFKKLKKNDEEYLKACDTDLPNHVVFTVSPHISSAEFLKLLQQSQSTLSLPENKFIIGGLHACGDLTSTLLRMFVSCENIIGLASVGCCYMKLTCRLECDTNASELKEDGYPMSQFVKSLPHHQLSYAAREMACHFVDSYIERLKADREKLKVHCYRAAFQHILVNLHPEFDRGRMKLSVKNTTDIPFERYCSINLRKLGYSDIVPPELMRHAEDYLKQWKNVMSFYTVRLSIAPVIETLILLDRLLYLQEQGISSILIPIFNPSLSPRNFLLLSQKQNTDVHINV